MLAFFATTALGMEPLLEKELRELGASQVRVRRAGVAFHGELAHAYRACLWSRVANRILYPLARFDAGSEEALYDGMRGVDWSRHMDLGTTFAVDFQSRSSRMSHDHYGALKSKDAVVDQFREATGERPSVQVERPGIRINVHLERDHAIVSIDLSGESLHRRGYRSQAVEASLKENLAAAILLRAGWTEIATAGGALLDPLCGAATLGIEAALIAGRVAPGLMRRYFGFLGWRGHDPALWAHLVAEARRIADQSRPRIPPVFCSDHAERAVAVAHANVKRAGLDAHIHIERRDVLEPPKNLPLAPGGLVVMNPPYGERLGREHEIAELYARIGQALRRHYPGWRAALFTGNPRLRIDLRPEKSYRLFNGKIRCELALFELRSVAAKSAPAVDTGSRRQVAGSTAGGGTLPVSDPAEPGRGAAGMNLAPGAVEFANRLRKNLRQRSKWARKNAVSAYRLYDADLPDYAFAIDLYTTTSDASWCLIQEYAPPASVDPERAAGRRRAARAVVAELLQLPLSRVIRKTRKRQRHGRQYERLGATERYLMVREGEARFWVNLNDQLDSGLFLDHRRVRALVAQLAPGQDLLNLFSYTATATVQAALAGARSTTSVDLSRRYCEWAARNLELNGISGPQHRLIRDDCRRWLAAAQRRQQSDRGGGRAVVGRVGGSDPWHRGRARSSGGGRRFGLILLDPPTFSNSKEMLGTFDLERDHVDLLRAVAPLLTADGTLIFTTHARRFRLGAEVHSLFAVEPISEEQLLPFDFQRRPARLVGWRLQSPGSNHGARREE
jgi:23S rRNA (guanine2445-N2)-methyltransferase / 23S rRNA (guanine2069-N7)-methyltransferase